MDVEHYDFGVCVGKQMCAKYRLVGYGVGEKLVLSRIRVGKQICACKNLFGQRCGIHSIMVLNRLRWLLLGV